MRTAAAKRPTRASSLSGRQIRPIRIHRDARSGQWVTDDIVSNTGRVLVQGGPITGGVKRKVLVPTGPSRLSKSALRELVEHMRLPA